VSPFCFTANELGRGLQGPLKNDSVLAAHAASAASNGGKVNFEGDQDQGDFKKMIAQSKFLLIIHGGGLVYFFYSHHPFASLIPQYSLLMLIGSISEVLGDDRLGHDTHIGKFVVRVSFLLYLFIMDSSLV
jgi:hypothetical protein